jgi:hypothetical protein
MENTIKKVSGSKQIVNALKNKEAFPNGLDTPAKDVVAHLKTQGVEVSEALVNNIKSRIRKVKGEKKLIRKRATATVPVNPMQDEFEQMVAVKELASKVGGFDKLGDLIVKVRALAA